MLEPKPERPDSSPVSKENFNESITLAKTSPLLGPFVDRLQKEGEAAWGEFFKHILNTLNIQPDYIKSKDDNFEEMRSKLENEPGILIANHPTVLDIFFVLLNVKRTDLLVMAQRKRFDFFEAIMGSKNLVRVPNTLQEFNSLREKVKEHVATGGLFVLFPSGGEEMATNKLRFKSGFRFLLSDMDPDNMVYSFYIDPVVSTKIRDELTGPPRDHSDKPLLLARALHIRSSPSPLTVSIDESYSKASEWQEIIHAGKETKTTKEEGNLILKHYLEKFWK